MPQSFWSIGVFWFYVELFHLLFYKYFNGSGIDADSWCTIAADVIWWQQSVITDVRVRSVPERVYSQRSTIICQRKLKT